METPIQGVGVPKLSPDDKWHLRVQLFNTLVNEKADGSYVMEPLIHWYFADVITACNTKYDVYHLVPKPLHQYISNFVMNPQEATPTLAKELRDKHSEAIDLIHIALMEKMLEE